jgi:drug/metabolite transporter (DMT)-like permease
MGIILGLVTALTWGGADFIARFAAHRVGALRTTLYMQACGFLLLTLALPWLGGWGHLADGSGWQPWGWGLLVGLINAFSTLSLYRSFEVGKMAVVAPVSASYPALTLLISWIAGDHISAVRLAGIFLTVLGVMVVAGGEKPADTASESAIAPNRRGIGSAALSGAGFGVLFWLLGNRVIPAVGAAPTVWMIRLTSSLAMLSVLLVKNEKLRATGGSIWRMSLAMGVMDTAAFVLSNFGMKMEQVAVISVLGSLYGAVTVGLAAIFLKEHLSGRQWLGIAMIFAGIFLISR